MLRPLEKHAGLAVFTGIRGQARQGTRRTRPKTHSSATRMAFPFRGRRLHMSYSPHCGRHSHTVRYRAAASRHTVSTPPARLRVRPGCHRPTELARAGLRIRVLRRPARDRGFSYIPLASRARERSSYPIDTLFVPSYPPPCFPPLRPDQQCPSPPRFALRSLLRSTSRAFTHHAGACDTIGRLHAPTRPTCSLLPSTPRRSL